MSDNGGQIRILVDEEYYDPVVVSELLSLSQSLREEIRSVYRDICNMSYNGPVDASGLQIHPNGVPAQFLGEYDMVFDYINDVGEILRAHDVNGCNQHTDNAPVHNKDGTDGTVKVYDSAKRQWKEVNTDKHDRKRRDIKIGLMIDDLHQFFARHVLGTFTETMSKNPYKREYFNDKSDLQRIRFCNLWVTTETFTGRKVEGDISVEDYKSMTAPRFRDTCMVRFFELKEAYEATFSMSTMNDIKNGGDLEWHDWNMKEPWLSCYRFNIKRRIGTWLFLHKHKWENTYLVCTWSNQCDHCRTLIK